MRALLGLVVVLAGCSGEGPGYFPPADSGVHWATRLDTALLVTASGPVQGTHRDGVAAFLGIPYAAPPVGDLRWKRPFAPQPWGEIRDATAFGPMCPQLASDVPLPDLDRAQGEDCLTLNAWTAAAAPGEGRPVMVWIHGGGFTTGSGGLPSYDGAFLAKTGGVVVVTINYRLGPLGFMAHSLLTAETEHPSSGNYGLLDQVTALGWVHTNARELGGDPENITIFGESAGGYSVCLHLVSAVSGGYFHRAIIESGGCPRTMQDLTQSTARFPSAESVGARMATALGCDGSADVLGCMRAKPAADVLAGLATCTSGIMCSNGESWGPNVDGWALHEPPGVTFASGGETRVPLLGGTNADEGALWRTAIVGGGITTVAAYQAWVQTTFSTFAPLVLQSYPVNSDAEAAPAVERILTEFVFVCPARKYALRHASVQPLTWLYSFSYVSPPAQAAGYGAFHASEIPYVFHNLPVASGYGPSDDELSRDIIGYWTRFAATGDPNGEGAALWPAFDATEFYADLTLPITMPAGYRAALCEQFDVLF